ncbi:MAG: hypothetical protein IT430_13365 [Phycisphaerales bacterium]|nr:hypothetical protein [Phycisphaerales bacterium]
MSPSVIEHLEQPALIEREETDQRPPIDSALAAREAQDLAEIMTAFTQVTDRLQGAHQTLQAEVRRLNHELHETNEQLRRSRQLAALGQMAAGIAHEIRNPLASIRLYASMLAEDLSDRPDSNRLAAQIARAVRDLDAVVGDVLNFARELKINPAAARVTSLLDQAIEACRGLLHDSRVEVRRNLKNESRLPALHVDAAVLNQALVNLIRNAIEAMSGDGTLTLSAALRADRPPSAPDDDGAGDEWCILTIDDTGPGIPPEIVERIFNPFFTTRQSGTGLGLAIVHRIVDAHGGEITVGRNGAGGASIALRLPTASRPAAAPAASHHT